MKSFLYGLFIMIAWLSTIIIAIAIFFAPMYYFIKNERTQFGIIFYITLLIIYFVFNKIKSYE